DNAQREADKAAAPDEEVALPQQQAKDHADCGADPDQVHDDEAVAPNGVVGGAHLSSLSIIAASAGLNGARPAAAARRWAASLFWPHLRAPRRSTMASSEPMVAFGIDSRQPGGILACVHTALAARQASRSAPV